MFQAPPPRYGGVDHLTLNKATSHYIEGETKAYPFEKAYPKKRLHMSQAHLLTIPLQDGAPTYNRQEGSEDRLRGKVVPNIKMESRYVSTDLVEVYAKIDDEFKTRQLANDLYKGSPWMYSQREGLPLGSAQTGLFVNEYAKNLKQEHIDKQVAMLVKEGHDSTRVIKHIDMMLDESLRKRMSHH